MIQYRTLNCRGRLLSLETPKVMGILNVTPDSFYDGGKYDSLEQAMAQVQRMLDEGADMIDIGAMSSRPGAQVISPEEEWSRLKVLLPEIQRSFPEAILSLDTVHSAVVYKAEKYGVHIINDISGGSIDNKIWQAAADLQMPYVLMHMKGKPKDMQHDPRYDDVVLEVLDFFIAKLEQVTHHKVIDIILDVGFGFGKSIDDNYILLQNLSAFQMLDYPVLTGLSRKSMIYKYLDQESTTVLSATSALHLQALMNGTQILRVHDVLEAKQCVKLYQKLKKSVHIKKT